MKEWDALIVKNTIFTGMQNNPDIEMTPPSQMQRLQGKNIRLLISYTLIHKACQILSAFTNQCHCSITVSHCLNLPHINCEHYQLLHGHAIA